MSHPGVQVGHVGDMVPDKVGTPGGFTDSGEVLGSVDGVVVVPGSVAGGDDVVDVTLGSVVGGADGAPPTSVPGSGAG